ncbi:MAG: EFR1 family ferrodoxin [Desulfobulbus sp.]|uniref:EFR1 family ferrodoxin n=1 Tax=Desulfobulbus sp. TaxID=895 RepID=UPI00284B9876|nr:EFR1 family ferrodoxin [Desulfobulbus sp.]MDR2550932.1 EFR1 family ferrodoxin [Desulfobulbus sp.]
MHKHIVAFFSPAGTTRRIAQTIRDRLLHNNCDCVLIELGQNDQSLQQHVQAMRQNGCCLWIGSPVYCDHAVPLVHAFIDQLPAPASRCAAVPFVAWGGVTSGLALLEMAQHLREKGYTPLGAAKVLSVHSSTWNVAQPLAAGHPDQGDLAQIQALVDHIVAALDRPQTPLLALDRLDYLSPALRADAATKSLAAAKAAMPPLAADEERCLQCGDCAEGCPVAAITLNPFPAIDRTACVLCLQCVRNCPQQAFPFNGEQLAARIADMAAKSDENKATEIFCP